MKTVNDIRFLEINKFWCTLNNRLFSADSNILPKDVHCKLVFDEKLADVNFHFTKNTKNKNNKPQIKIIIIDKQVLYKILENTMPYFFMNWLEPFDMISYKARYENEVGFVSLDNIEDSEIGIMVKNALIENFSEIAEIKPKGNKLIIKGDLNSRFERLAKTEGFVETLYETSEYISESYEKHIDGGMILTYNDVKPILRINGEWFTIKQLTAFDLLCFFVSRKTAYAIICRAYNALEKIKSAQSYADTENDNYPIRIVLPDTNLEKFQCPKCKKSGLEHICYA